MIIKLIKREDVFKNKLSSLTAHSIINLRSKRNCLQLFRRIKKQKIE